MAITLFNGAEVPTNSDAYDLTADLQKLALSLNLPVAVSSQAERDGLAALAGGTLQIGQTVLREDQSMFVEKWDGTSWRTIGHSEWTKTGQVVPANTVWGVGALTIDAAKTTDTAFVTHPTSNVLKFRDAGTYIVTFTVNSNAALDTRGFIQFDIPAGTEAIRTVLTGENRGVLTIPNYRAAANGQLVFTAYHESSTDRTMDFRIRVTRIG